APAPPGDYGWQDLRPVLDEEVNRLPEKYRAPFVLCYLEGLTNEQAARQLGCAKGTVGTRLAWAREQRRRRPAPRGPTPTSAPRGGLLSAAAAAAAAAASVPPELLCPTVNAAARFAAGAGAVPSGAASLAEGVLKTMSATKFKTATVLLVVIGLAGV